MAAHHHRDERVVTVIVGAVHDARDLALGGLESSENGVGVHGVLAGEGLGGSFVVGGGGGRDALGRRAGSCAIFVAPSSVARSRVARAASGSAVSRVAPWLVSSRRTASAS